MVRCMRFLRSPYCIVANPQASAAGTSPDRRSAWLSICRRAPPRRGCSSR
ncbi:hypothetical protein C882_3090 [Caenispirillum salinarum AK4]|uniref:Uncharacterized protein n=1 Tax=Caenispirillum salinarum AK4 TaxID=1238182 RepID=K9HUU3_9PROT|nr:hypothetical protein C882_3090 [Caenispirillum salinarum AK4]